MRPARLALMAAPAAAVPAPAPAPGATGAPLPALDKLAGSWPGWHPARTLPVCPSGAVPRAAFDPRVADLASTAGGCWPLRAWCRTPLVKAVVHLLLLGPGDVEGFQQGLAEVRELGLDRPRQIGGLPPKTVSGLGAAFLDPQDDLEELLEVVTRLLAAGRQVGANRQKAHRLLVERVLERACARAVGVLVDRGLEVCHQGDLGLEQCLWWCGAW